MALFKKLLEAVSSIRCEGLIPSEARDLTNKDNVDSEVLLLRLRDAIYEMIDDFYERAGLRN
jgi:hypothetical protein